MTLYAYCVMPDHVHLALSPSPSCDVVLFIGQFKNLTQRAAWRYLTPALALACGPVAQPPAPTETGSEARSGLE